MKKGTLILVAMAIAFAASVYYYEFRRKPASATGEDVSKPAFAFSADEVTGIGLIRGGQSIAAEKRDGQWVLTQPVETRADQDAVGAIANAAAIARISRTLPAAPDRLAAYGLAKPAVTVELKLKSGAQHRLELGAKDFSGLSVYGKVDSAKDVALLPESLLESADKSLDELRDRSVLSFSVWDATGFDLRNRSGEIAASKKGTDWQIEKPRATAADSSAVTGLLSDLSSAKMTAVESDTAKDLAKYSLARPAISFAVRLDKGVERTLEIGAKTGEKSSEQYYARDSSRDLVFRVDSALVQKLGETFADLREKAVIHFDDTELRRVRVRNRNQTLVAERDTDGKWKVQSPADRKGKEVESSRFLDPLLNARATKILDAPPAAVAAKLAEPAIEIELTDKAGKATKISISALVGEIAYVRTSAGATVYEVGKQTFEDLNFKLADIVL
jgi:hypothetical protein